MSIDYVVSDTNCNTYAYGTRTAVRLTRDGGSTWSDLDPQKNLPPRPVNSLAFDPTNPSVLYAVLSDFDEATPGKTGHVFKTTNALSGAPAWANVSPALNEPFNVIAVDPAHPLTVYAGSDTGLFRSIDGGLGWKRVGWGTGLFSASVFDIKINPTTKQTVVFTYGRGAWTLEPSAVISR